MAPSMAAMRRQFGRQDRCGQGMTSTRLGPDDTVRATSASARLAENSESDTASSLWLRLAALGFVLAGLGLPLNDLFRYALLLLAAVAIFGGGISRQPVRWLGAAAIVALTLAVQHFWPAPRLDEGHNVIMTEGSNGTPGVGLPADAFRQMAAEFDLQYPAERRCNPTEFGCWRASPLPARPYAFSADSIYSGTESSRRVTGIDFADPVWQRLGFLNEQQYNWTGTSDIRRGKRAPWWMVLHPWPVATPYFVMLRMPADFISSRLCWRGVVLWEDAGERFTRLRHIEWSCRPIENAEVGRRIFGVSAGTPLAMKLEPPAAVQLHRLIEPALALAAAGAVLMLLVRWRMRSLALPLTLVGLALLVVFLHDASFIGGIREFDGGDDGLVYEGMARIMMQHLLNGEFAEALKGTEAVFYYGGPGLRYFRTLEHFIFGDAFFGYLSLILLMPVMVFLALRRFFEARSALALTLIFVAIPAGALFGTTFFQYAKWASRGFADPAAAILFLAGFVLLVGPTAAGPGPRFRPAFGAGLMFALALWLRPNLAPAAGILLGGAGLAALWQAQLWRVAGLCIGFLPVLGMALHNWVYGGVFVLFSANATIAEALPMAPSAWLAAFGELLRLNLAGEHIRGGVWQLAQWLSGPSESLAMVPVHALAIAVLVRVAFFARGFDPWIRLTAVAMLAQHPVAFFYLPYGRYYFLAWLLTGLVCAVWVRDEGVGLFRMRWPRAAETIARHPVRAHLEQVLDRWTAFTGISPARR